MPTDTMTAPMTIIDQVIADAIDDKQVRALAETGNREEFEGALAKLWPSLCVRRLDRNAQLIGMISESPAAQTALMRSIYEEIHSAARRQEIAQ